jgi:phosphatidylinositol glycan class H protein
LAYKGVDISRTRSDSQAEESLLVIRGFGIQTSTSSSTYLSTAATRFIPTTQIQDIVIHEAFKGFDVRFYLAVIVEGEPGVLVVFPVSSPLAGIRSVRA